MKIVKLEAENVKRLRAVTITPDGAVVRIQGNNAQGKTSVLDSIAYAMGGEKLCPTEPIRRGAQKAHVIVELDENLVVERRWTAAGSRLEVRTKDGAVRKRPQEILDGLVGKLSFDPLAFMRVAPREQAETLRRLAGVDFTPLDARRKAAFDTRTGVNRQVGALEARLAAIPEVDAPDAPVSAAELLEEHQRRQKMKGANDVERAGLQRQKDVYAARKRDVDAANADVARATEALAAAQRAVEAAIAKARSAETAMMEARNTGLELKAKLEQLVDPDLEEIPKKLRDVEALNERIRAKKARAQLVAELAAAKDEAARLDTAIAVIDEQKAKALAEAKFPVPDLSFDDAGVKLSGLPLEQASGAEQLRVSLAMGIALNPKLRVLLIRDGSLLDEKSLGLVAEMAEKAGMQVWIETVGKGGTGIVIEDGQVEGAASASEVVAS